MRFAASNNWAQNVPKCPQNSASFQFLISGTHRYKSNSGGTLLTTMMHKKRIIKRHGKRPNSGELNDVKGSHAPMYTKQAQFSTRSITDENASFSVWVLKCPSHEMALPKCLL